ncbi:MAG TPA: YceI family protein [Longimicrobiales bacterium]|nr:YceI family protein [Longimicrobiales bacterium]
MPGFTRGLALLAASVVLLGSGRPPAPERYEIDPNHSYVGFSVRHMMVSNVRGKFNKFSGTIELDPQDITRSRVDVEIDAASINTEVARRDDDLRSANFFDVAKYPRITFAGKRVEKTADGLALVGDLTIRDVTKEVRVPFELSGPVPAPQGRKRVGAEATFRIKRQDFGLLYNRVVEGAQVVGDEVKIELEVEALTPAAPAVAPNR